MCLFCQQLSNYCIIVGVGRGTVREAMKVMFYLGLIDRNSSRNTFVTESACEKAILRVDAFEMIEVRKIIEHDSRFHQYIFSGTGNHIIIELMQSINMALKREQASVLHNSMSIRPRSLEFHGKLLDAIKTADSKAARKIMLDHILDIEEEMYAIFREQNAEQ